MNRGRGRFAGAYFCPRGRSSQYAGHSSYRNRHMNGADGSFSDGNFSSRDGMSHGRRGNAHHVSPGSDPRLSNHRPTPVFEYRKKKPIRDETSDEESLQQDLNDLNVSDCESKRKESSVASNSASEGDFGSLSVCSSSQDRDTLLDQTKLQFGQALSKGAIDGRTVHIEPQLSFQSGNSDQPSQEQHDKSTECAGDLTHSEHLPVIKPFDICLPKTGAPVTLKSSLFSINKDKRNESKRLALEGQEKILRPGMVLLKGYLSTDDQVKIVKLCRDLGLGPGGFYQPGYRDGAKLQLKMMCLGKNWDPDTSTYGENRPIDGAKPPNIPLEFDQLVEKVMNHSRAFVSKTSSVEDVPLMSPDLCIINFYSASGHLGLHQDKDESEGSLRKGLPVVSFSIGDAGEFLYSDNRDEKNAKNILLESGDVLIFGGKSRHIFHGVRAVRKNTAPKSLLDETNLCPGRLNLTFRKY